MGYEKWLVKVPDDVELAAVSGNKQKPFKLIGNTGGQQILVSETVCDRKGEPIYTKQAKVRSLG